MISGVQRRCPRALKNIITLVFLARGVLIHVQGFCTAEPISLSEELAMLRLALLFLLIALIAGVLGFPVVAGLTYEFAQIFFFLFIVLAVIFLIGGVLRGSPRDIV